MKKLICTLLSAGMAASMLAACGSTPSSSTTTTSDSTNTADTASGDVETICYIAAGALVSIAGVFDTAYKSNLVPVLGMSSNSTVFANMFPMAVGVWLAKKSNPVIGIVAGSLSVQFLILGLSKFTMIGVSDYMQTCIRYSIWLIFMIYRMNEDKIARIKERHARVALARATRAKRAVPA